ncbi:hypothetical protein OJ997_07995 [Solirubrobacter phytolaccae]|uniref:RING-type domain-containing protein n=1 Tax=Solirubrobacter phytolaccae TaxID=1404360 RepID=A0A9X3N8J3_9ACTN|nr:MXAN_6230/SCO0854 family RING domain-containing protein [Solirubrobacter phytolaccae]MDA0180232.1 hypothetical protein [Solirubrobacter phytolaccae]
MVRRRRLVFLEPGGGPDARTDEVIERTETRAAELGYVFSAGLRAALRVIPSVELAGHADTLLTLLAADRGAGVAHVPLFRRFPDTVPDDTFALYVERTLAHVFASPEQPCLNCTNVDHVYVLDPCGHLVCSRCWDATDYSGCPICHRRIAPDSPFLQPSPPRERLWDERPLTLLDIGRDLDATAAELFDALVARANPLGPQDREDLVVLVRHCGVERVPEHVPVRETMALIFGTWLEFDLVRPHLRTATDVLRVLFVALGGEADLVKAPKPMPSIPRPLRRFVLQTLEGIPQNQLAEDVRRHADHWKRVGEKLHPYEFQVRYPNTALAFAAIRRTRVDDDFTAGAAATVTRERVRLRTWATQLEEALVAQDLDLALALASRRPGELLRRFDHLLRAGADPVAALDALREAAPQVPAPLLLTAMASIRARTRRLPKRVFFPRGEVTSAYTTDDDRPLLDGALVAQVVTTIQAELLARAARLEPFPVALLDEGLKALTVPFRERHSARALVRVPRGSRLPLPDGDTLRLFLHWTEPGTQRVDLDLSVALYDAAWRMQGLCDYTELKFAGGAAKHSGDLTSAPAPLGASEFIDLHLSKLRKAGVRHLAMLVFSYNDVPFETMTDAFAGFMSRRGRRGEVFDPRTVEQRFDLQGNAKIAIPAVIDLEARELLWADLNVPPTLRFHSVMGYRATLAHIGHDLQTYFGAGARPTLWELAAIHAAARSERVIVRARDGALRAFDAEPTPAFLAALDGEGEPTELPEGPMFAALVRGDVPFEAGYALDHPGASGADLAAQLR